MAISKLTANARNKRDQRIEEKTAIAVNKLIDAVASGETDTGNNTVYLKSEADLPNQTATTWTMDANTPYKLAASFSTDKQCLPELGSSLRGDNLSSYVLTYTNTNSSMFKGVNKDFYIHNISLDAGITNTCFEFEDTSAGVHRFIAENVQVLNADVWGKFTDLRLAQSHNCSGENVNKGIEFFGTDALIWSFGTTAFVSTSPTFVGVDMGTAQASVIEFDDLFMISANGVGFSGLAASGNVPVDRLGRIYGCEFSGGMTDLQNLSVNDDTRWVFRDNTPTADSYPDALISFSGNSTPTAITAANTPTLITATWQTIEASQFATTQSGTVSYLAERPIKVPVTAAIGLVAAAGGTNVTLSVYVALDGAVIPESETTVISDGGTQRTLMIPWQLEMTQGQSVSLWVENKTNNTNVIVDHGKLRLL